MTARPVAGVERPELQLALDQITETTALAVAAHVHDEQGVWRSSSGLSDLITRRPAHADAYIRAGSIAKSVTATAILQLVAENRLGLEDTLEQWLPGLVPGGAWITLRHLLNHTSGLFNFTDRMPVTAASFLTTSRFHSYTPSELIHVATAHAPYFAPGESWHYSNSNYVLLGLILEQATGKPFEQFVRDRIFAPLGLRNSFLPGNSPFMPGPHLRGYAWPADVHGTHPIDITVQNPSRAWASGDLISTTSDIAHFFAELFAGHLLEAGELAEMQTTVPARNGREYGLGVVRMTLAAGTTVWGNTGAYGGYVSFALTSADGGRSLAISVTPRSGQVAESLNAFAAAVFS